MLRLAALSQYPVVTRSIPGVGKFLFRDEFVTPLAAGQVHGTFCEPGPGRLIVVDTGGALSISGGALQVGRGSAGDPGVSLGALRRRAGQVLALALNASDLTSLSAGYAEELAVGLGIDVAGGDLRPVCNGAVGPTVAALSIGTDYVVYLLPRTLGSFLFLQGAGRPELLWVDDTDETAIRLARILGNQAVFACDWIRVPQALWLPAPLLYDRFQRADGSLGSSDGYAGDHGLGAVASAPWDRIAGWTVASNRAQNTPPESGQLLTNGGLEEWATATTPTGWTKGFAGGNSVNQEASVVRSGTYACRLDVVDPVSYAYISQVITIPAGTWTRIRAYVRASSAAGRFWITFATNTTRAIFPSTTEWTLVDVVLPALTDNPGVVFSRERSTGVCSLYLDDLQVDSFATPDLFATQDVGTADVLVGVRLDANPGDHAVGAALCLDDPDDPQNYLVVCRYQAASWRLIKCVAGVPTVVATSAATPFAAGAWLWVAKGGDQVSVWYNGERVISPRTISDAGIVDNTRHGMFAASDVPGLFGGCEIWARGTGGEYQILETLTAPVPEENLVLNPSFEAGEGDTFTSWSKVGVGEEYPGNLIEQDLTDYSDGKRAAKITRGGSSTSPYLVQYVPVTVGASYEVSFWGHSSAVGGIGLRVTGYIGGTAATDLVSSTTFGLGDSVWRRYARTFTVPPNYTRARIIVFSAINPGIAWIDNVRLRRIA